MTFSQNITSSRVPDVRNWNVKQKNHVLYSSCYLKENNHSRYIIILTHPWHQNSCIRLWFRLTINMIGLNDSVCWSQVKHQSKVHWPDMMKAKVTLEGRDICLHELLFMIEWEYELWKNWTWITLIWINAESYFYIYFKIFCEVTMQNILVSLF